MSPQGTNPTAAVDTHPPIKWNPIAADACRALLFPTRNMGGVCFCAPTRMSDNGRCRSFAPEMFSDCGGCLSGAIVLGHEHRGRMLLRPYTDVRRRRLTFVRPRNGFQWRRIPVGRYCSLPGTWGAYAIRPYTDVRQWPMSFVRPRNVFRRRRIPVGRYCSLPGTWGAYAIRPYTDVRRRRLTFIRLKNGFQRRWMPVRRYCSRP